MPANPNMQILVVDDYMSMRRVITNVLNQLGYMNTIEAEDGVRALAMLRAKHVDLVITDWNMPQMSGLEYF